MTDDGKTVMSGSMNVEQNVSVGGAFKDKQRSSVPEHLRTRNNIQGQAKFICQRTFKNTFCLSRSL